MGLLKLHWWALLLVVTVVAIVGRTAEGMVQLILVVEAGLLVLSIRKPLLALVALMINEITISHYFHIFGSTQISSRLLIAIVALVVAVITAPTLTSRASFGPKARRLLLPALTLFGLMMLSEVQNVETPVLFQYLRYIFTGYLALFLIPWLVVTRKDLRLVGVVVLGALTLSGLAAVLQHFWTKGIPVYEIIPGVFHGWGARSTGLSVSPIALSTHMLIGTALFGAMAVVFTLDNRWGWRFLMLAAVMALGLYFTYTRSALYGLVAGVLTIGLLIKGRARKEILLALLIIAPIAWIWLVKEGSRFTLGVTEDGSAASRIVLWQAGIAMAKDNPIFGVGHEGFFRLAPQYAPSVEVPATIADLGVEGALGRFAVHNDFLHVWLSFGTPALIVFAWFQWIILVNYFQAYQRARDPWIRGASLGLLAATVSYIVHIFAHNGIDTTILLWFLAGFSQVMLKFATQPEEKWVAEAESSRLVAPQAPPEGVAVGNPSGG